MNEVMPDDKRVRALNSSSNLFQRFLCPGSAEAEEGLPNIETDDSKEGTLLHWHDEHPEIDRKKLTHEQRGTLDKNKNLREKSMALMLDQFEIPEDEPRKHFIEFEMFLNGHDGLPVEPRFPGHSDHIYYFPRFKVAFIYDSKFGRNEVPTADINFQLRSYAIMFADCFECDQIYCAITQPWAKAPNDFTSVIYTADNLPDFRDEVLAVIKRTRDPEAKRNPSPEACAYCRAKAHCREAIAVTTNVAVAKIRDLSFEELEDLAPDIELAQKVILSWENRIRYILERNPELLKKHEFARAHEQKSITDPPEAYKALRDAGLLSEDPEEAIVEILSCCNLSRSELKEMLAKKKDISRQEAEIQIDSALGPLVEVKPKRPSIQTKRNT